MVKELNVHGDVAEQRLRAFFDGMTDGVQLCELIMDDGGHAVDVLILDVNSAYERHTGITREQAVGRRVSAVLAPVEPEWLLRYGEVVRTQKVVCCDEYSAAHAQWFRVCANSMGGNNFSLVFRDITETKLRELENIQFKSIVTSSDDAIMSKSLDGIVTSWNPGAQAMFGYRADEIVGCHIGMLFPPARLDEEETILGRIRDGERLVQFESVRLHKDGMAIDVSVTISPIHDENGKIIGASKVARNVSDRRRSDNALRESVSRFEKAIESLQEGVVLHNQDGKIDFCNSSMERILGLTAAQLKGLSATDAQWNIIHDDGSDFAQEDHPATVSLSQGIAQHGTVMGIHKPSGELTWISVNSVPLGPSEKPTGVIVTAVDITDRRQFEHVLSSNNEELYRAKAVAEKANLAKSEFLSRMSHELRSPLNAVLGFAQLIESGTPQPSASQMRSIHQILQAGWYLLDMINEILDLSRIESGTVTMSQESVSLSEVLQDCLSMIEPQAQQRGLKMTFPWFGQNHHVLADRTRLKQVLLNLLSNAIKYNQAGGSVVVQCVATGNDRLRLSVSNTGAGLTPEQVDQLFQPFNRLGREGGTEQGTGIGLVVTKKMVELMGGAIGAESSVGVGSVFWVEFLVMKAPEPTGIESDPIEQNLPAQDVTRAPPPPRTLLCVEDNPANLLLIEELIGRRRDLKLLTAIDAELGIKMARAYRPDIILMDINLSGMDGFDALRVLRVAPATAHIPVMALSASATARDIVRGLDAGFFRYLTKPIHVQEFMDSVDMALIYAAENAVTRAEVKA